ncbi:hypothetical protein SDC9_50110 [bioreactor metagenome]|uniref:Uncharacterized protein n=1 Tax=bioreactor metagenome TaxID=1076179 RepID=A0A644WND8_9ZZZZ
MQAVGTALACNRVDSIRRTWDDGIEAAYCKTSATGGTEVAVDHRLGQTEIIGCLFFCKASHDQVKVGCIDIAVSVGLGLGEGDEGAGNGGFSGSPLTAENEYLMHLQPPSATGRNRCDTSHSPDLPPIHHS